MKTILIFVILTFFLSTCKKNNAFGKIEIEAIDYNTGEPIEGIEYLLYKTPPGDLLKTKTIRKEKTGTDGKLTFSYSRVHLIRKYQLWTDHFTDLAEKNPNYFVKNIVEEFNLAYDTIQQIMLLNDMARIKIKSYFVKNSYIRQHLYNENCFNQNDSVRLRRKVSSIGENYGSWSGYSIGCVNSFSNLFQIPSGKVEIQLEVIKNSVKSYKEFVFNIEGSQTVDILLNY